MDILARVPAMPDDALGNLRLQLPTSLTSRRGRYSCGFDLCLSPKGHSKWTASKRLSAEGHLLEDVPQHIDSSGKDVGNCKRLRGTLRLTADSDEDEGPRRIERACIYEYF